MESTPPTPPRCLAAARGVQLAACFGGIFLKTPAQRKGIFLGESDVEQQYVCQVLPLNDASKLLLLVGSRRHHHLRIWVFNTIAPTSNEPDPVVEEITTLPQKCSGFGCAKLLGNALYIATGLGIGFARVWRLALDTYECALVFKSKARTHTILALHIDDELNVFVGTNDSFTQRAYCQQWKITPDCVEQSSKHQVSPTNESKTWMKQHTSDQFLFDVLEKNSVSTNDLEEYIKTIGEEGGWAQVFPANLLNPHAYVGEEDDGGLPHGRGERLLENGLLFQGEFFHGAPAFGKLIALKPRRVIYNGSVNEHGERDGMGDELRAHASSGGMEHYRGGFQNGLRHGLFQVQFKNTDAARSENHGVFQFGFYYRGRRHGLLWQVWHETAPHTPFAKNREEEMRRELGSLGCLHVYKDGVWKDEFNFYCAASAKQLLEEDKKLLNVKERDARGRIIQPLSFQAPGEQGVYLGDYCWACMKHCAAARNAQDCYVCMCCKMRVHKSAECAWPKEMFDSANMHWHGNWTCPRCQVMFDCNRLVVNDRHGEPVIVASKQELERLQPASTFDNNARLGIKLFAPRRPDGFNELMEEEVEL